MKVYIVQRVYHDYENTEYLEAEYVFSTKELAEEYVRFEIHEYKIAEFGVFSEPMESTVRMKRMISDGKIEVRKTAHGNILIFK